MEAEAEAKEIGFENMIIESDRTPCIARDCWARGSYFLTLRTSTKFNTLHTTHTANISQPSSTSTSSSSSSPSHNTARFFSQGPFSRRSLTISLTELSPNVPKTLSNTHRPNPRSLRWRTIRGDQGHLMLEERIASKYEVIRAIVSDYSPCCGGPAPEVAGLERPAAVRLHPHLKRSHAGRTGRVNHLFSCDGQ